MQQLNQGMVTECIGLSGHSYWHTQEERPSSVHVSGGEEIVTYSYHYAILPNYACMCMYVCECMCTLPIHPYMYVVCMMYVSPIRPCPGESSAGENGLDRIEDLGIHVMQNYTVVLRIQILSTCAMGPTQGEDGSRESLGDQAWV